MKKPIIKILENAGMEAVIDVEFQHKKEAQKYLVHSILSDNLNLTPFYQFPDGMLSNQFLKIGSDITAPTYKELLVEK